MRVNGGAAPRRSRAGGNLAPYVDAPLCGCPLRGCRGGSRTARRPRHPQHTSNPDDNCLLRHRRASPYIDHMRHSRAEHSSFPRRGKPRIPKPDDNCPLRHCRASLYIGCMRHSHAEHTSFPRRREPRIPAALVWMSGPLALWERVRVRVPPVWTPPPTSRQPATTAHCAVAAPAPTNSPARNATKCNQMQLN